MKRKFEAEVDQRSELTYVRLAGVIDEDNDLADLVGHIRSPDVIVNLAGITEINNCGVRDWVRWLTEIQARSRVALVECSPSVVAKLNLVSNFSGDAYLQSIYVPYFCPACNSEKAVLLTVDELPTHGAPKAPVSRCDTCDGVMDFDDLEESYFAFVENIQRTIPQDLLALVEENSSASAEQRNLAHGAVSSFSRLSSPTSTRRPGTGTGGGLGGPPTITTSAGTGGAMSSAAALRRLREKTGLRTHRLAGSDTNTEEQRPDTKTRQKLIFFVIAASALGIGLALVIAFVL